MKILSIGEMTQPESVGLLDLACGDGYLIPYCLKRLGNETQIWGVDMSDGELEVARKTYIQKNIRFEGARAQNLPLEDASIDAVLCHMAFMLMLPLEPVVAEIARVLRPNGFFAAIVGNPQTKDEFVSKVRASLSLFLKNEFPNMSRQLRYGDDRVHSMEGLSQLFNRETGFSGIQGLSGFELEITTNGEGVWDIYKNVYTVSLMPHDCQQKWKKELFELVKAHGDAGGNVRFKFPMLKILARKV